jgi:hypothetical protein
VCKILDFTAFEDYNYIQWFVAGNKCGGAFFRKKNENEILFDGYA